MTPGLRPLPTASSNRRGRRALSAEAIVCNLLDSAGVRLDGQRNCDIIVHHPGFYRRVLTHGSLGLGESYMDGWWDCRRIDEFVHRLLSAQSQLPRWLQRRFRVTAAMRQSLFRAGVRQANAKTAEHYDLGNRFFELMLGPTMAYSCGYWARAQSLDEAQTAKHRLVCEKLDLQRGERILDVGCGWGGFARFAAETVGCEVVGVTISREQAEYARSFCSGLPVEIQLCDFRAMAKSFPEPFDKVVSIGMFEHVGARNYRRYFEEIEGVLRPGGLCLIQTVGRHASDRTDPWVERYIFPGGELPTISEIASATGRHLVMEDLHNFGADYDRTLMAWWQNCRGSGAAYLRAGGERFERMWKFYLMGFAGNFRARDRNQLWQIVVSRGGLAGGYRSKR